LLQAGQQLKPDGISLSNYVTNIETTLSYLHDLTMAIDRRELINRLDGTPHCCSYEDRATEPKR